MGSLRKAIDEKCKECIYDPIGGPGTWRQQVQGCTSYSCPLFEFRPLPVNPKLEKITKSILAREFGQIGQITDHLEVDCDC